MNAIHSSSERPFSPATSRWPSWFPAIDAGAKAILPICDTDGYGISQRLAVLSHDQFQVNPGSLFPSLYRLEQDGKLKADWRATENNRRAKYYRLTASGRRQLEQHRERWNRVSFAVMSVLEGA